MALPRWAPVVKNSTMVILGLETSCDDTGVAIYDSERGLLAHKLYSQLVHAEYGGIVPELASRDHIRKCLPLVEAVLDETGLEGKELDGVAYTSGPGLAGALLVGASLGRSLAWGWQVPSIGVHHMEGHLLSPMLEQENPGFPFLALLVSGGHTLLADVLGLGQYTILGESLDDAVGEAFDKTAKLLGLGYPGGPEIARRAQNGKNGVFKFPRPMTNRPGLQFSFSGLKTAVATAVQGKTLNDQLVADVSLAFQEAAVATLVIKCRRALEQSGRKRLVVAGGVSANQHLRDSMSKMAAEQSIEVFYPRPQFATDNGAMIALVGCLRMQAGQQDEGLSFYAHPRWKLSDLPAVN